MNALLYGFCVPAGLGVALWIIAHAGGTPVAQPWLIGFGAKLWNLGVLVGVIAILLGDSTGFENFEMPRYAVVILFLGYLFIGTGIALTLHQRRERRLEPAQWFILAALFWFPWIYSTAGLLLAGAPVRGITQAIVAWWYSANLISVWVGLAGLGTIFYFLPRLTNRTLHSSPLANTVHLLDVDSVRPLDRHSGERARSGVDARLEHGRHRPDPASRGQPGQ